MPTIEESIKQIQERNKRVEMEKAWETSFFRKIAVAGLTYFVIVLFFSFAKLPKPFINAIVPTLGFLLSTLSLSACKQIWLHFIEKK